ncbi:MAG: hypothetical protein GYA57_03180 [Myxococcales bacterium]|nr:hypothetical protein [Myxococcales bacterium]
MNVRIISLFCLAATTAWAAAARGAVGGPDRFGYGWADSEEADVTYEWLDAGTTNCVTLNDDQESVAVPIGFTFNFYGTDYTTVRIGSNGYLSFKANTITSFGGQCPLPVNRTGSFQTVNLAVYGFFQDLNPAEGGTICYATLGEAGSQTFVVSWVGIDYYQGSPAWGHDPVTFQIVLYEGTNEAQVNIQESGTNAGLPRWDDNTTIGIENDDGSVGLSLCDWTTSHRIPDNYAVRFRASDSFGVLPGAASGTVPPGGTTNFDFEVVNFGDTAVSVTLSATGTAGWTAVPAPAGGSVAADGGSLPFSVAVTAPAGAAAGDLAEFTVTATDGTDTSRATIQAWATHGDSDWQPVADLPEALQNVTLLADDDYVYAITGESVDDSSGTPLRVLTNRAMRWDPATNGWDDCAVADLPTNVTLGGACLMHGHIYYVGGLTELATSGPPATPAYYLDTLLDYDIAANTWTERSGPYYAVMSPIVACDPATNRVFVYGGYVDTNRNGEVEIPSDDEPDLGDTTVALFQAYDVAADRWTDSDSGTLAVITDEYGYTGGASAVLDGRLYITAGSFQQQDDTTGQWLSYITRSTSIYDIAGNTWTEGPMLPSFVSDRAGVVFRGQLCVLGGITSDDAGDLVIIQDWWCLGGDTWVQQTDPLPDPVYAYGAAVLDDFVYISGGTNDAGDLVAADRRWPTDTALPSPADPIVDCGGADADADADADAEDVAADADADADTGADADAPGDTTGDTTADGGGDEGGDDGCGCRVTSRPGAGTFLSLLFVLGAALLVRRRG